MATININPPAKISRNTAADGDFLWKQDFEVLYNNDIALRNAIEQGTKELTPSSGINIDADKNVSVNKGKGLKFNGNALEVDIKGKGGVDVTYESDKIVVSAYNAEQVIDALSDNVGELQEAFEDFQDEVEHTYVPSAGVTNPNKQYAYSINGWVELADGHDTASFWRPSVSTAGDISWTLDEHGTSTPPATQNIKGAPGTNGTDGKTPSLRINVDNAHWQYRYESTEDWQDVPNTPAASGTQGEPGAQGPQGWTPTITAEDDPTTSAVKVTIDWPVESHISEQVFYIPSGDKGGQGDPGERGPNGYTPSVSAESFEDTIGIGQKYTFYWPATAGIEDVVSKIYHGNTPTVISSSIPPDPTSEHPKGGSAYNIRTKINGTEYDHIINIWHGNDGDATTVNFDTATGHTMSGNGGDSYPYGVNTNVIATQAWVGQQGFITKDVNNLTNYYKNTETSAKEELTTEFANKVDVPNNLSGMYLVLRTNADGTVNGWSDLSEYCYSKSSAKNTFIQQSFIDNTLSGTGANAGNKLGANTNVIPTKDWLDDNYLPLSGGTVSGQVVLSATTGTFDQSYLKCINNANVGHAIFGLGSGGGAVIKTVNGSNESVQVNVNAGSDNSQLINVKTNNGTTDVGYLIPAKIEQNGWSPSTDDKILHIVLES